LSIRNLVFNDTAQSLHDKLIALLEASDAGLDGKLKDETSLIESGRLDSLGLFNLALFIEREVDGKVDITAFDLAKEWNTITDILNFITKLRSSG